MLAYTYIDKGDFQLIEKSRPTLQSDTDAIVRVTLASICSSDLHIKYGSVPLSEIEAAYELFEKRLDGVIKVAMRP